MTADELQSIARRLANSCHCRYWLNLYGSQKDITMAIQCLECYSPNKFRPTPVRDLEERGFRLAEHRAKYLYLIDRTNPDGTPFVSTLP